MGNTRGLRKARHLNAWVGLVGLALLLFVAGCGGHSTPSSGSQGQQQQPTQLLPSADASGQVQTFSTNGSVDFNNPFFQGLGTNGRKCVSCHQPGDGWTITPTHIQARFAASAGKDPLFTPNDGSNCPSDDVSTLSARQAAFSLLLTRGVIRVGRPIPSNAEFYLSGIDDPYNCASASDLSLYRRPLPATNLRFESSIMWDGRENGTNQSIFDDLKSQAKNATLGHAQAAVTPTDKQLTQIVNFETALFTAQSMDAAAGVLTAQNGLGGAQALAQQSFAAGENNFIFGQNFNPEAFALFNSWLNIATPDSFTAARESIARGQEIFNQRKFNIDGVRGLNDAVNQAIISGTCSTCHSSTNAGTISTHSPMNIGTAAGSRRTPDLPLYTFTCTNGGGTAQVTDPGVALTTGKCFDIGKFKTPGLRGLAARAPYFHDGSAATLADVVTFYNNRFSIGLTAQEKADLIAFLGSL